MRRVAMAASPLGRWFSRQDWVRGLRGVRAQPWPFIRRGVGRQELGRVNLDLGARRSGRRGRFEDRLGGKEQSKDNRDQGSVSEGVPRREHIRIVPVCWIPSNRDLAEQRLRGA